MLGQVAGSVGRVEDLVVEDGEVKGKTKSDWVSGSQLSLSDIGGILLCVRHCRSKYDGELLAYLVGLVSGSGSSLALIARGELSQISVVVTLPVH